MADAADLKSAGATHEGSTPSSPTTVAKSMAIQETQNQPLLIMRNITKRFPGVLALNGVDLSLDKGEIVGLIGENGAGKSTLMKILEGDYSADEGQIIFDGSSVTLNGVQDSIALGISLIHQELCLAPNLDVASNIFLGHEPRAGFLSVVNKKKLNADAAQLAKRVGITAAMTDLVESLSPGEQQLVEIAKALSYDVRILVLDEPTSSLSPGEAEKLFEVMRKLKGQGVAMVYISHRLGEVEEMCDRAVVLRDGCRVGGLDKANLKSSEMVKLMVGRDISRFFPEHTEDTTGNVVLSVHDMEYSGGKEKVSFELKAGEILGVAGLVGSGRTELIRTLFGVESKHSGDILLNGKQIEIRNTTDAVHAGIGLVPEDRKELGVVLEMSVAENISLAGVNTYNPPFLDRKRELEVAKEHVEALEIKTPSLSQQVQYLSGGNQQKVALSKWLSLNPKVLILDEPTRGIDVGSKSEIYKLIRGLAEAGMGVIMVSSEMEEIIGLSDRVMVMHEGKCMGVIGCEEINEKNIMQLATGGDAK